MHEIKSFKIFQTAKVVGVLYACVTVILLGALVGISITVNHDRPRMEPVIWLLPILVPIYSFIVTAFLCWLYNLIAARIGGIAFELAQRSEN